MKFNKWTLLIAVIFGLLALNFTSCAQTNMPPLPLSGGIPAPTGTNAPSFFGKVVQVGIDLWAIVAPVVPDFKNDIYTFSIGYGKNTGTGQNIEAGMLSVVNTNSTGINLVGGKIGSQWE